MWFQRLRLGAAVTIIALMSSILPLAQPVPAQAASTYFFKFGAPTTLNCSNTGDSMSGPFTLNVLTGMSYSMVLTVNGINYPPAAGPYSTTSTPGIYGWGISPYFLNVAPPVTYPNNIKWAFTLKGTDGIPLTLSTISFTCTGLNTYTNLVVTNIDLTISATNFTDGRCNQDPAQSVAIYPDRSGGYVFYAISDSVGYFALHITHAQLEANPDKGNNYLIAEKVGVRLYRLAGGLLQVNRMRPDKTDCAFSWDSCG